MVDVLGLTIILPLLPFYAEKLGAGPLAATLIFSIYGLCQFVAGPFLGQLSDRIGRKPVLLVSQIGTFAGFLMIAFAPSLAWVFAGRIIDGLTAGNLSVAQAYIADVTEPKDRAKAFGFLGIAFGVGFLLGPAISGFLSSFGYHYPFLFAAGLSATSVACTFFLLGNPPRQTVAPQGFEWGIYAEFFKSQKLTLLLSQFLAFIFAFATLIGGLALYCERRFTYQGNAFGATEVGYVFAYSGLVGIIVQGGFIGRLVKITGEKRLVSIGFIAAALGFGLLALANDILFLVLGITAFTFGHALLRPCLTSLITQAVPRDRQGAVMGLMQSLMSIAQVTAPVISGVLIERHLLSSWAWMGAAFSAAGWAVLFMRRPVSS